ncbi:cytochrome P450 [Micromonospora parathelypteridis]|uniref:Cytochrome P450 n=1 Tax=Micromonospora parathelypteridis TaxID=1839617 RepID=A0A840WBK7_9ACTN|nr:cytochrome P450 [Micromonospora parathelypteridis]MBB5481549.1 cytochrome P450 [Micromonospora parathelypteridis]GGO29334.1 cytochrome P450 [Micromonospora parathelypteridis]
MRTPPCGHTRPPGRIDLADPGLHGGGDPHAAWRMLRRWDPVSWQPAQGGSGFWAVTRHTDVRTVLADHSRFTSTGGVVLSMLGRPEPAQNQQFAATDPPRHGLIRGPLQQQMTARAVARHEPAIRSFVREMLRPADGLLDFASLTSALPMAFLGPMMDIPTADWPALARWVSMSVAEHDPDVMLPGGPSATLDRGHRELFAYLLDLVISHRRRPRGDLVDVLGAMPLRAGAIVANCYSLLLGGSAAFPHVPRAVLAELIRTGRYEDWARRPERIGRAVEEALRFASPAGHFMRLATSDTALGGVRVAAGDAVVVWLGSANRDESVFRDPDTLDPDRHPNRHLAFGEGRHYCLGAAFARLTLRVFFEELFATFTSFEPAGEVERVRSNWLGGIKRMPVLAGRR